LTLSESLDDEALELLLDCGLRSRHPGLGEHWVREKTEIAQELKTVHERRLAEGLALLEGRAQELELDLRFAIVDNICRQYP